MMKKQEVETMVRNWKGTFTTSQIRKRTGAKNALVAGVLRDLEKRGWTVTRVKELQDVYITLTPPGAKPADSISNME